MIQAEAAVQLLVWLVHHSEDEQVLEEACWALAHLSEGVHHAQEAILAGCCRPLVALLL